jgi:hypothetical protein
MNQPALVARFLMIALVTGLLSGIPAEGFSQITKVMGQVTDSQTSEPIPFANIILPGTTIGTLTDFDGQFALEFTSNADSIRAFLIGYNSVTRKLIRGQFQEINLVLSPQNLDLPEVTITYSGNPAEVIIGKVILNKEKNSLKSFETYQYDAYTKIELDANNLTDGFKNNRILKPFGFVWSYLDTSTINGKSYLPVFITETMSEVWFRKNPRVRKEIIRASRISGFENESVSQFLGNLAQEVDLYKNFILIFEKNFVSPIADGGITYYKYYLVDSAYIGNRWCYHIMFKPRRQQELTFTGNLWINDTTFAVKEAKMRIAGDANINFINDLEITQEFEWTSGRFWMLTKDKLSADFNIINDAKKTLGFFGHKTTIYRNFQFDIPGEKRFSSMPASVYIEPDATKKGEPYWAAARPEALSETEKGIYAMVDSVKSVPSFHTYTDIIYMVVNGYLKWGKIQIGPYFNLFSWNGVEGARFRLGFRTSNSFSKKLQLRGYLAYGTWDQTLKYSADLLYMFSKNPRRDFSASYKFDVEQLGTSATTLSTDNILTSLFHRGPNNKLTMVREYRMAYEHEWFAGLMNTVHLIHREVFPLGMTEFVIFPNGPEAPSYMNAIYTSEFRFDTRVSFHERFVSGEFDRVTISSTYPIFLLSYSYGFPSVFKSDFEYHRLSLNISQWFNFKTIGWSKYIIEAGKIWGTLPYPLLRIHDGNQTFFYDESASNLMNYYEFLSDAYISASYTHHFDGLLFNHIPLLRKLKWREVAHVKGVFGTLTPANAGFSLFPDQLRSLNNQPYWEAGAGIENIFKIIRVDAIWRLSHLNDKENPNVSKFGIFVSLFFSF